MQVPSPNQNLVRQTPGLSSLNFTAIGRLATGFFGCAFLGLLMMARTLDPDPSGMGTHQQLLDLPPCGFKLVFGNPCPSCGMTTSWAHLTRGQISESIESNAGGFLLGIAALAFGAWLILSSLVNRWVFFQPHVWVLTSSMVIVILTAMIQWYFRIS